ANRPARDMDVRLKQQFDAWFESHPRRRKPLVLVIATGLDQLTGNQELSSALAQTTIAAVEKAIAGSLKVSQVLPFSAGETVWNLGVVSDALSSALAEAKRVQRNRRRVEGASQESGVRSQLRKGGRGLKLGIKMAASRASKVIAGNKDGEKRP